MTVGFLIDINDIITAFTAFTFINITNNVTLRKVNVKPYGSDKMYMNKDVIGDKFYQIIDQFNEWKITPVKFYAMILLHKNIFLCNKHIHFMMGILERVRYCLLMIIE